MILPYVFLLLGAISFSLAFIFLMIAIGFRHSTTSKTNGYLERINRKQNVYIGGISGRWYKSWLDYTYIYRVDGKQYTVSSGTPGKPNNMKTVVAVIYQKKHPDFSYIKGITFPVQPIIAVMLFVVSSLFLIPGIILLISS